VVVNGHDHFYERFAPQDGAGMAFANGIRQFIVGTGGASLSNVVARKLNSETVISDYGIIKFDLRDGRYGWEFISVSGNLLDRGEGQCH
jgi:hypothetical protein